ncbi:MAG: MFS transporter [Phycisphaerales bacterium]|nr:MFS transporter [Phycisphaerales bacterium]
MGSAMLVMSVILAIAGISGALDILCFIPITDDYPRKLDPGKSLLSMVQDPLRDRDFRIFLGYVFTLNLAIGFVSQYIWLNSVKELGMSNLQAQVMIIALPLMVQMIAYPFWGALIDRLGRKPVLLVCTCSIVFGSLGWLAMGPDVVVHLDTSAPWQHILWQVTGGQWSWSTWLGYLGILLTTANWPGVELANFNIVMDLAGGRSGGDTGTATAGKKNVGGAAYVVVNSIAVALGGMLSGLFASVLTRYIEGIRMIVPMIGIVLTYHDVLFLASSLLRVVAAMFVVRMHEPKSIGTRAALEFMGETFYANMRNVVVVPSRVVEQAYRWTYLIRVPVNKRIRFGGLQTRRWWRRNSKR